MLAADSYDGSGALYKTGFSMLTALYDQGGVNSESTVFYDLIGGNYSSNATPYATGSFKRIEPLPMREFTAGALTAAGVR
ncbi:hypothetical protein D3C76_1745190 [compost metagenome]